MKRRDFNSVVCACLVSGLSASCAPPQLPRLLRTPPPKPSYGKALGAIRWIIARDAADPTLAAAALPRLYEHGKRVRDAVLLFHGFTNCPQQFDELARRFYHRGCNVFVPRIPRHGLKDRLTNALADLTGHELAVSMLQAYHLTSGLGERISVIGLSLGGSMALWLAQAMPIDLAVPIAPFLSPIGLPRSAALVCMDVLYALPSAYRWWDPRLKAASLPTYAYPGYPTHAVCEVMFFGDGIFRYANHKPLGRSCVLVTNEHESAVNNSVPRDLLSRWKGDGANVSEVILTNLGKARHDIIDPTTFPEGRTLVYPRLEKIVLG
jgi:pimeloyl-ACP methyl ester carboxylesterase